MAAGGVKLPEMEAVDPRVKAPDIDAVPPTSKAVSSLLPKLTPSPVPKYPFLNLKPDNVPIL